MTPEPKGPSFRSDGEAHASSRGERADSPGTPPPTSLPDEVVDSAKRDRSPPPPPLPAGRSPFTPAFSFLGSESSRPSRDSVTLSPGSVFGVYLVGPCIGEGGMARVYQAEHAGLRRKVALKVLIDGFARDREGRERFLREARIAAAIKHPNVVNIFDVGIQDDIPYLVMELLEGEDLESWLQSKGALDEATIIDVMIPVVAGLCAVHDAGIVHRDLKPGNIFLARSHHDELEPKLLDFGISKTVGPDQLKLTSNHGVLGTPFYIAPEGLLGAETTPLSDQYSLGVVMYECATGCTPFKASAFPELSRLITAGQYTPATTQKPELSKRLVRIIERAMSRDPKDRFKDQREMGRELLALAGQRTRITWGLSFGATKSGNLVRSAQRPRAHPTPAGSATTRRPPSIRRVVLGSLPTILVLLAILVWYVRYERPLQATERAMALNQLPARSTAPPASTPAPIAIAAPTPAAAEPDPVAATEVSPPSTPPTTPSKPVGAPRDARPNESARRTTRSTSTPVHHASERGDSEADWSLPSGAASVNRTNRENSSIGANDAPIFD